MMPRAEGFGGSIVTNKQPHERPAIFTAESVRGILSGDKTQTRRAIKPQPIGDDIIVIDAAYSSGFAVGRLRDSENAWRELPCPYWVGQVLWVREPWAAPDIKRMGRIAYSADGTCGAWIQDAEMPEGKAFLYHGRILEADGYRECFPANGADTFGLARYGGIPRGPWPHHYGWRSPMFMPRWASRIDLAITEIRHQKLQDISEEDARAEGVAPHELKGIEIGFAQAMGLKHQPYRTAYANLWNRINGKREGGKYNWDANPWVRCLSFRRMERPR